jgi:hypothetical protein
MLIANEVSSRGITLGTRRARSTPTVVGATLARRMLEIRRADPQAAQDQVRR